MRVRWPAALAGTAVLVGLAPALAAAGPGTAAPTFLCRGIVNVGSWQRLPIERFQPIEGVASRDAVTGYSLAATRPQLVVATNGKRLKVSTASGCAWDDGLALGLQPNAEVPLSGTTSTIVSTAALPSGRVLAAVREGTSGASRPHVVGSDNGRSGYRVADGGLPPQGAPRFLEAADDGVTVYLVLTPTANDGSPVGGLPGVPDVTSPTSGGKAGLLYASTDGGRSWQLRTSPDDLPAGGGGLDRLAVDRRDPNRLYAVSNGLLLISTNGGRSFVRARFGGSDVSAVETLSSGRVAVFTSNGDVAISSNGGQSFASRRSVTGVTSAAYRQGDSRLAIESSGRLALSDPGGGATVAAPGIAVTPGSLIGDVSAQASYHALSGHDLLRYADPAPVDPFTDTEVDIGDLGAPPPPVGTISPAARTVQLKVGDSTLLDYTLAVPKSPTPLDLFFLVDTSTSMDALIENLKTNIGKMTASVQRDGIDLRVGLASLGTGSKADEDPPGTPSVDAEDPTAEPPVLYKLFRRIGRPDGEFGQALARVVTKRQSGTPREAQLAALREATAGLGIRDPRGGGANPLFLVQPGQDAGWRAAPGIRRLIVHATDEAFDNPDGSPRKADGSLDYEGVIRLMNEFRVQQLGITTGVIESEPDLARIARGTKTFAPPGGADCGQDVVLPAGAPLVCDTQADYSALIAGLVRSLVDRQTLRLVTRGTTSKVIRGLDATGLRNVDVTVPNTLSFKIAVSCRGQSVGRYTEEIAATLRETRVASTRLTVDCLGQAAAAALLAAPPALAAGAPPPAPPVAQAPAAVVPAPPAAQPQVQPQSQPQAQAQVNPLTAAAMQQQEQLQLALALQAGEDRPQAGEEMAMVGRRRADEGAALVLLAAAMAASAGLGLARLRSRPDAAVVRARR